MSAQEIVVDESNPPFGEIDKGWLFRSFAAPEANKMLVSELESASIEYRVKNGWILYKFEDRRRVDEIAGEVYRYFEDGIKVFEISEEEYPSYRKRFEDAGISVRAVRWNGQYQIGWDDRYDSKAQALLDKMACEKRIELLRSIDVPDDNIFETAPDYCKPQEH